MRKIILAGVVILLVIAGLIIARGNEDTWLCVDGQWLKHGNPTAPQPNTPCAKANTTTPLENQEIIVETPQANQTVSSPIEIKGQARGNWYFEASFPIQLVDENGQEIATAIAQAQSDWMTTSFVPFELNLDFNVPTLTPAILILKKDNPSGLPEYDKQIEIPLQLTKTETTIVKVFFNNSQLDPEVSCNKVFGVERTVPKTPAVAQAALTELLKGTTEQEKTEGFFTSINPGVKIQKITIENGVAKVDFDQQLEYAIGGSCRVAAIRAQITETLKQFPSVQVVIIAIDGRTEDILQP
ncbi:MAG: hypothetical protein A2744_03420 [Candidatus Buchananbacteria bacterium RIFCSPHIGHO2_01_FULL_44_11]|uniref:GerMN domain-containing protein n=1 Tax=Candidatus Buchananbacteria bacterium RIFCSPHIGHO2_01_FULL_44_11 TaxID=1797535 RepID=A0A1G1Y3W8_9BACT|nr:MAG: hypothetical protein A2744_03420 [Candidatus Buchananbacteria bacterium RIFCSPHIGHO2_01_FULL_44_11]